MGKTLTAGQVLGIRHDTLELTGEWGNCIGTMPRSCTVFLWGQSGGGKSTAALSLCKELARHGRVLYVPLEDGYSLALQNSIRRLDIAECGTGFQILDRTTLEELDERLLKRRAPEFIAIDSFQYMGISYRQYSEFLSRHRNRTFIIVSHADGRQPAGRAAKRVMYDADLKIYVEGHVAFSKGRFFGPTGKAVLWREKAERHWGTERLEGEYYIDTDQ